MIVRESLGFTRGGDVKTEIGIGREKLIGDFVDEITKTNPGGFRMAPINKEDKNSILIRAVAAGRADIVKLLLSDPAVNPAYRKNFIIGAAAVSGSLETVEVLLADDRVNPADNHNEALYKAAKEGKTAIVKRLMEDPRVNPADAKESLDKNFHPVHEDNYIIREAAANGHFDVLKELLRDPRVKIKGAIQMVNSKLNKVPQNQATRDKWTPILDYLISHHKAQEELTDKEIIKYKEKINKV
jgi:ankyrin repeat protein